KDLKADEQYKDGFVLAEAHTFNDDMDPKADKVALKAPYSNMPNVFGVTTHPTVILNMSHSYSNNGRASNKENLQKFIDDARLSAPAAGISARSSIEGSTVIARATVKAAKAGEYRVGAWLVEDNLYATQANGVGIFDYDFDYHEAVIRIADSRHDSGGQLRYRGHTLGELAEGQVVDYVFTMELQSHWRAENCRLVFFVTGGEQFNVVNAIETTSLNSSVEFSYTK
ncbi:MAG: Omp28-related outer membrane protein, partial [Tidjanibacter sp.]|nr:Omp28-related outer membrane protein [Tidjanibacter sp.]